VPISTDDEGLSVRYSKFVWLLIPCALSNGCLSTLPVEGAAASADKGGDRTLGSVALYSERLGHSTFTPNTCRAGDREFFLGGDFIDEKSGFIARLVFDPLDGAALRIFASGKSAEKSIVFHHDDCRALNYTFAPTSWRVNDVYDYRISVSFDCSKSGDAAKGEVSATHCH
jgi:hypothetical protein